MPARLAINEAGFAPCASVDDAHKSMERFVALLTAMLTTGCEPTGVYVSPALYQCSLAPGFRIADWLNGQPEWTSNQEFMLTLLDAALMTSEVDTGDFYACRCRDIESQGLLAAYALDGLATSQSDEAPWDASALDVIVVNLEDHSIADTVMHCSRQLHRRQVHDWLVQRFFDGTNVEELWIRRGEYFPYLHFSDKAQQHMPAVPSGPVGRKRALLRLFELNAYAERRGNVFDENEIPFEVRGEGGTTMGLYGYQREARCSDGITRVFRRHCDVDADWRLYFEPDVSSSAIHIGLIGPHPDTATGYS